MLTAIHNSVIRDNIEGNRLIEAPESIRRIIDTREFQRLRLVKQMGLSSYVFPTAEHSRFSHSLGVFATGRQIFGQLRRRALALDFQTQGLKFDDHSELDFSVAALCHDLGHSAFSHVLETVLLPDGFRSHEECTRALLTENTEISREINNCADIDSVINLLKKEHANKALNELISSTFDVDRCDYILRDSNMSGVEYGKYDLNWLFHAMTVDTNKNGQPILLLDGPRGLDALRQFLSARRYLHRQVYYHPTVRGAQILMKGIFARVQDLGENADTRRLCPKCLHPVMTSAKLSLGDFIETTDVEVLYMIRNFEKHSDPVLNYLSKLFTARKFPKSVLDSAKSNIPLSKKYRINETVGKPVDPQGSFFEDLAEPDINVVTEDLQNFIASRMRSSDIPSETARYLVAFDPAPFKSTAPTDMLFSFKGEIVPLESIDDACVGFDLKGLFEAFVINRIFVPREFVDEG